MYGWVHYERGIYGLILGFWEKKFGCRFQTMSFGLWKLKVQLCFSLLSQESDMIGIVRSARDLSLIGH
ncbi:MAG: hypothetical protein C7B44_14560 [Sulfobacillus thermosulfidooxidans]|nr:hypothetical protein CO251_02140 [Sulfobacillus sp. hq2]PSR33558.1 MAG: hypothetical protein C7B44_14560 [Sulfobacillus thermosulfidooxidans]